MVGGGKYQLLYCTVVVEVVPEAQNRNGQEPDPPCWRMNNVLGNCWVSSIRCKIRGPKGTTFIVELALAADRGSRADLRSRLETPFSTDPAELEECDSNLRSCSADWLIGRFEDETTEPWIASSRTGVSCWGRSDS